MKLINKYYLTVDVNTLKVAIRFENSYKGLIQGEYNEFVTNLIGDAKTDFSLNNKEKIYFLPGTNVPRVKLKDLFADTRSKTCRNYEEADKIIVGKNTINKLFTTSWGRVYKTKFLTKFIDLLKDLGYVFDERDLKKIEDSLEFYDSEYVECNYLNVLNQNSFKQKVISAHGDKIYEQLTKHNSDSWGTIYRLSDYCSEDMYDFLTQATCFYHEKGLLKLLNGEEATVIDEKMYNALKDMFESPDTDNVTLGIEILANSNYDESMPYILLIMNKYSDQIYNSPTKKHVNFKALMSYLSLGSNPHVYSEQAFDILENTNNFTLENVSILFKEFVTETISDQGFASIETISLNRKYCKLLSKQLVYNRFTEELLIREYYKHEELAESESGIN